MFTTDLELCDNMILHHRCLVVNSITCMAIEREGWRNAQRSAQRGGCLQWALVWCFIFVAYLLYQGVRKGYEFINNLSARVFPHQDAVQPDAGGANGTHSDAGLTLCVQAPTPQKMVCTEEKNGQATHFGYKDPEDNGRGTPLLDPNHKNGINTNNDTLEGVAIPQAQLAEVFGIPPNSKKWQDWAPVRKACVRISNGKVTLEVPIVDFGPGQIPLRRGVIVDETYALNRKMGGDGDRTYVILANCYPNR